MKVTLLAFMLATSSPTSADCGHTSSMAPAPVKWNTIALDLYHVHRTVVAVCKSALFPPQGIE